MKHSKIMSMILTGTMLLTLNVGTVPAFAETDSGSTTAAADAAGSTSSEETYANGLFDTSRVHTIDVQISEEDWADLLENPLDKTKYKTNVTIDGVEVDEVSFATKGNTSLSSVASSDSDRYSFKVNFGKYVDDQTYYGLDKLNLNNIYADATYMKDYLSYMMFREAGAYAPLCSYIWVTINGEDQGLYLALQEVSDSWLDENTDGEGELYKPETEELGNMGEVGDMPEMTEDMKKAFESGQMPGMTEDMKKAFENGQMPGMPGDGSMPTPPSGSDGTTAATGGAIGMTMPTDGDFRGMPGGGGFGSNDSGASLKYTDDEIDSYSDIFDNNETKVTEEDEQRVIASLKGLSEASGSDLENYLDTDEVIRYFAAHNFVMNYDSYTGSMLHNYYLYENDGKLAMIPWDYNLAYGAFMMNGGGGMPDGAAVGGTVTASAADTDTAATGRRAGGSSDATSIVNYGIDTPLSGASLSDRPMWAWIANNSEYLEKYHDAMDELISGFFESGDFDTEIDRVYNMILPYVSKDPTAWYTEDEFTRGYETLKSFCDLRAESIRLQLDGKLSASTDEQDDSAKVDASDITISDMGTQNMGGQGHEGMGPGMGSDAGSTAAESGSASVVNGFTDVSESSWYADAVKYVTDKGLMNGTGTSVFQPNGTTTRGMLVTILYRYAQSQSSVLTEDTADNADAADISFSDVKSWEWYGNAVEWAVENGIVTGFEDGTFRPDEKVSRQDMAVMLYRYAELEGRDVSGAMGMAGYEDADSVAAYADDAMRWAVNAGIINGMSDGTLSPRGSSTRAQLATVLMRFAA